MGAFEGYFLYCDLDGTLFDDEKRVSAKNRAAIESFVSQGGRFGVATGRAPVPSSARSNAGFLSTRRVSCSMARGCMIWPKKQFLSAHYVDRAWMERLARRVVEVRENACLQVFTDTSIYETNPNQRDDPNTLKEHLPITSLPMEQILEPALKLLIAHTPSDLDAIHDAVMREPYIDMFSVFRTSDWYLEFVTAGVSKGSALEDVRARCGNVGKILAIGDYSNDLEMVLSADIGGAPLNAIDAVKAAADIVLSQSNNESCVAAFLARALKIA